MDDDAKKIHLSLDLPQMTERKVLLALGSALIIGMLVIAAFAMGVYVGEHGWTKGGLSLRNPQRQQPNLPQGNPQNAPDQKPPLPGDGQPNVLGRITNLVDGKLVLATFNGPRSVAVKAETQVKTQDGAPRTLDDLTPGQNVAIFGHHADDGQTLVAEMIIVLTQQPDQ